MYMEVWLIHCTTSHCLVLLPMTAKNFEDHPELCLKFSHYPATGSLCYCYVLFPCLGKVGGYVFAFMFPRLISKEFMAFFVFQFSKSCLIIWLWLRFSYFSSINIWIVLSWPCLFRIMQQHSGIHFVFHRLCWLPSSKLIARWCHEYWAFSFIHLKYVMMSFVALYKNLNWVLFCVGNFPVFSFLLKYLL